MMKQVLTLVALMCFAALAANGVAAVPKASAGSQSSVVGRQSPVVGGAEAIAIPQMLSYQGKLTDTLGVPVADTLYAIRFRLYAQPTGGTQFWQEDQQVRTQDGLFSTLLGSITPVGSVPDAGAAYLGMAVEGGTELVPRLRIASAAYAYLSARAADADLLQGRDTSAFDARFVNEGQADAVTGAMLVNGTVLTADVGDTAVTMAKIAQAGATTGQVVKWTGSAWSPGPDNTGGGSGVTNVYQDTGIICVPNPITSSGNVKLDLSYGDGRYVNVTGDSLTGALRVQGDLRVYGKGRIGPSNSNAGTGAFVVGQGNSAGGSYSSITGGEDNSVGGSHSHAGGGSENKVEGDYAFVGGGQVNYASGGRSSVVGGSDNEAYGVNAAIGGGRANVAGDAAADTCAVVAGGYANLVTAAYATVGGGMSDTASARYSGVLSGRGNRAGVVVGDSCAVVAGGRNNRAAGVGATVGGGLFNQASASVATVCGGWGNNAAAGLAVVCGGFGNVASGEYAFVGGGTIDTATGCYSGVLSGRNNRAGDAATDTGAVVAGGYGNRATGRFAAVGGGQEDTASGDWATVGGGRRNVADTIYATVGGGYRNEATAYASAVGGGYDNGATGYGATVGGGYENGANGGYATVGGGYANYANGLEATVSGGKYNHADEYHATVGGGFSNVADDVCATVSGGQSNTATADFAVVGGGHNNGASGSYATVPGGYSNEARGSYSLAAGYRACANDNGSFVWSDSVESVSESVYTTGSNQWRVRARGGAWFYSNLAKTTGAYLAPGSNSWESACDSMTKEDFRPVDRRALLDKVATLRVRNYKMKDQNDGTRHIGPVAQDFHSAFGYGGSETSINLADADGVALAAIQALYDEVKAVRELNAAQQAEIEALRAELKRR